jgi:hypothetical protein
MRSTGMLRRSAGPNRSRSTRAICPSYQRDHGRGAADLIEIVGDPPGSPSKREGFARQDREPQILLFWSGANRRNAGTTYALLPDMAAIFALIFVPAVAAVLCMLGDAHGHLSLTTVAATTMFLALITGLIVGLFRLAQGWDEEGDHHV